MTAQALLPLIVFGPLAGALIAGLFGSRLGALASQAVTTLAGSAQSFPDAVGASAYFNNPTGVAVDAAGFAYVADLSNNRVRKVSPAGSVATLAGSGAAGSGDGLGVAATFSSPSGVAVGSAPREFPSR